MTVVDIYTDGACRGNPGPGGWGALLLSGEHRKELNGAESETTNNRMELTAAIEALAALKRGGLSGMVEQMQREALRRASQGRDR